eukprot:scaffold9.g3053.t1
MAAAMQAGEPGLQARQPLFGGPGPSNDQVQVNIEAPLDLDDEIEQLRSGVGRLKQVSEAIQEETRLTGQVMEGLEAAMEQARATLRQTMRKLNRAYRQSKSNHVLYVFLFAIAMFFVVYAWARVVRLLRWIF